MFRYLAELILFTIVVSVLRSIVTAFQRMMNGGAPRGRTPVSGGSGAATMLQQDPVCGTYVAIDSSLKRVVNGRVLHFCSPECRDKYAASHG